MGDLLAALRSALELTLCRDLVVFLRAGIARSRPGEQIAQHRGVAVDGLS